MKALALTSAMLAGTAHAGVAIGQRLPPVTLSGEAGGLVDGKPWSSDTIKGKVWAFFYVDPDERSLNEDLTAALDAEKFPLEKYGSMSVLNMAATWLPNSVLASKLEEKQKQFPRTIFAKDLDKALVKQWGIKDDAYVVLVFDKKGNLLFNRDGQFTKADIAAMISTIKQHLDDPES